MIPDPGAGIDAESAADEVAIIFTPNNSQSGLPEWSSKNFLVEPKATEKGLAPKWPRLENVAFENARPSRLYPPSQPEVQLENNLLNHTI